MYTMNLKFKNELVEQEFEKLCDSHLSLIINDVIKNHQNVVINQIFFEGYNLNILLNIDEDDIIISSNYKKMETLVYCDKWEYSICYDNHPQKLLKAKDYRYHKNNKILIKKNIDNQKLKSQEKEYVYTLKINDHSFTIHFIDCNECFDEESFIKYLLNDNIIDINNVNELYMIIVNSNDISKMNIELVNQKNYDEIFIYMGKIIKYHLTYNQDGIIKEIYFKDDEFYQKETSIKKLNMDNIYVKKFGGKYGRRKEN